MLIPPSHNIRCYCNQYIVVIASYVMGQREYLETGFRSALQIKQPHPYNEFKCQVRRANEAKSAGATTQTCPIEKTNTALA
jgi:hypothetical protein